MQTETIIFIFAVLMLLTGVLTIATTSIGLECYVQTNMNKDGTRVSNMWYLGITLFLGVILTIASFPAFYKALTI